MNDPTMICFNLFAARIEPRARYWSRGSFDFNRNTFSGTLANQINFSAVLRTIKTVTPIRSYGTDQLFDYETYEASTDVWMPQQSLVSEKVR
jgi:hypothetical protein